MLKDVGRPGHDAALQRLPHLLRSLAHAETSALQMRLEFMRALQATDHLRTRDALASCCRRNNAEGEPLS